MSVPTAVQKLPPLELKQQRQSDIMSQRKELYQKKQQSKQESKEIKQRLQLPDQQQLEEKQTVDCFTVILKVLKLL